MSTITKKRLQKQDHRCNDVDESVLSSWYN